MSEIVLYSEIALAIVGFVLLIWFMQWLARRSILLYLLFWLAVGLLGGWFVRWLVFDDFTKYITPPYDPSRLFWIAGLFAGWAAVVLWGLIWIVGRKRLWLYLFLTLISGWFLCALQLAYWKDLGYFDFGFRYGLFVAVSFCCVAMWVWKKEDRRKKILGRDSDINKRGEPGRLG